MHREVVKLEYRVSELEQQRAELLEALKEIITSVDKGQCVTLDKAREAITKAEAAE